MYAQAVSNPSAVRSMVQKVRENSSENVVSDLTSRNDVISTLVASSTSNTTFPAVLASPKKRKEPENAKSEHDSSISDKATGKRVY